MVRQILSEICISLYVLILLPLVPIPEQKVGPCERMLLHPTPDSTRQRFLVTLRLKLGSCWRAEES